MNLIKSILLFVISVALTGCPINEYLILYNNSNSHLVVKLEDKNVSWPPKTKLLISQSNGDINWDQLKLYKNTNESYPLLSIQNKNIIQTVKLNFPRLGLDYVRIVNGRRESHFQFENDGILYIVPYDQLFPVTDRDSMVPFSNME